MLYMHETDMWEAQVCCLNCSVFTPVCVILSCIQSVCLHAGSGMDGARTVIRWSASCFHVFLVSSALFPFLITAELSSESV